MGFTVGSSVQDEGSVQLGPYFLWTPYAAIDMFSLVVAVSVALCSCRTMPTLRNKIARRPYAVRSSMVFLAQKP